MRRYLIAVAGAVIGNGVYHLIAAPDIFAWLYQSYFEMVGILVVAVVFKVSPKSE